MRMNTHIQWRGFDAKVVLQRGSKELMCRQNSFSFIGLFFGEVQRKRVSTENDDAELLQIKVITYFSMENSGIRLFNCLRLMR